MNKFLSILGMTFLSISFAQAATPASKTLEVGSAAPTFSVKTQDGKDFDLKSRKGSWTVLYFYPKADTPGCTKQACGFRDDIEKIHQEGAEVFGVSADTVKDQNAFHKKYHLNFTLLADAKSKVIQLYGTQMSDEPLSNRWTFIIGPDLTIRNIQKDVDPVMDAKNTAKKIAELKKI
jgi:peroxiredoxin Q/BCP